MKNKSSEVILKDAKKNKLRNEKMIKVIKFWINLPLITNFRLYKKITNNISINPGKAFYFIRIRK